jgi:hypothetical protein
MAVITGKCPGACPLKAGQPGRDGHFAAEILTCDKILGLEKF